MRRITALAALALSAAATPAHAGYVGVGIGPGADLHGSISTHFDGGSSSGRLAAGHRFGPFGIEASLSGSELTGLSEMTAAGDHSAVALGIDGKVYIPIAMRLEGYLRGGLNKTWVVTSGDVDLGYSGRGVVVGGGAQLNLSPLPMLQAAIFAEYARTFLTLRDDQRPDLDGEIGMFTLGVSVGTSF